MEKVLIAFSGGIDSSFLLHTAARVLEVRPKTPQAGHNCRTRPKAPDARQTNAEVRERMCDYVTEPRRRITPQTGFSAALLGREAVLAVTAASPTYPEEEVEAARLLAARIGVAWRRIDTNEMENLDFTANSRKRCYYCKSELFSKLKMIAEENGAAFILDGANADDLSDHRPGRDAAAENNVVSPLALSGMKKADIRELALAAGLPNWNKPSMACLASRFPYGTEITGERLKQVEGAEAFLIGMGFSQARVRWHDTIARIEVDQRELPIALLQREDIAAALKELGFTYVCLDIEGFRSGSMNEVGARHAVP